MTFGDNMRAARQERKMSQAELARLVGCNQQMISWYESGKSDPTVTRLLEIARALDVEPERLLHDIES